MLTSVAFDVCQLSAADCPCVMLVGLTEIEAVGDAGGGAAGGGGGATFLAQALNKTSPAMAAASKLLRTQCSFTMFLPLPEMFTSNSSSVVSCVR